MMTSLLPDVTVRLRDLFFSRDDVYARSFYKPDGTYGYSPSCACSRGCYLGTRCPSWRAEGLSDEVLVQHLEQATLLPRPATVGSYSTSLEQTVKWLLFDIDAHAQADTAARWTVRALVSHLHTLHLPAYLEDSGHGYHLWIFTPSVSAALAQHAARQIERDCPDLATDIEVYPKQAAIGTGFGNLVKLPLGLHWSGKRCLFLDPLTFEPLDDQISALFSFERVDPLQLQRLAASGLAERPTESAGMRPSASTGLLPGPPCATRHYQRTLAEGEGRNNTLFKLAVYLLRAGFLDTQDAKEMLTPWNQRQQDPLTEKEFDDTIEHAYNGGRYSYGCSQEVREQYPEECAQCPVCHHAETSALRQLGWGSKFL